MASPVAGIRHAAGQRTAGEVPGHRNARAPTSSPAPRTPASHRGSASPAASAPPATRTGADLGRCAPRSRRARASSAADSPDTTTLSDGVQCRNRQALGVRRHRRARPRRPARRPRPWRRRAAVPASAGRVRRSGAGPSSSVNTPATQAATYSPTECPITAAGSTPQERHSCVSPYSTANSAGCVHAVS